MIGLAFVDLLRVFVPEIVSLFFSVHSNFFIYFISKDLSVCLYFLLCYWAWLYMDLCLFWCIDSGCLDTYLTLLIIYVYFRLKRHWSFPLNGMESCWFYKFVFIVSSLWVRWIKWKTVTEPGFIEIRSWGVEIFNTKIWRPARV